MRYYEDMLSKWGFNDGETAPDGVEQYREVYIRAMNVLLADQGSCVRLRAFDRGGMHNDCIIAHVHAETGASLARDACDDAYHTALQWALDMDLDDYVRVEVHIDEDSLTDALAGVLEVMDAEEGNDND